MCRRAFLSTLSLRRATYKRYEFRGYNGFLSTLSLRRATLTDDVSTGGKIISIHALLAESDKYINSRADNVKRFLSTLSLRRATMILLRFFNVKLNFYPRSPCGERQAIYPSSTPPKKYFYPRSPCGERPSEVSERVPLAEISIHALLAESDLRVLDGSTSSIISIHALLAESDLLTSVVSSAGTIDFYPRSPCGERPTVLTLI